MRIRNLQKEIHYTAHLKGWWQHYGQLRIARHEVEDAATGGPALAEQVLARLALVHSEVSEACEAVRSDSYTTYLENGKPEGVAVELADAIIRIMDVCEALGLDLEAAIEAKLNYNATRPHRHGGRSA